MSSPDRLRTLLRDVKRLAREYHELTGRPLGVTAEVAEYEAARLLRLQLAPARQAGYDAIRASDEGEEHVQIKGRCIFRDAKPGQRIGAIDVHKSWDAVLLVLLDKDYEPVEIYEADRSSISEALLTPGSRARNERGQLTVRKFKSISTKVWPPLRA